MKQSQPVRALVKAAREPLQGAIQEHLQKSFNDLPAAIAVRVQEAFAAILIDPQLDELTGEQRLNRDISRGYSEVALQWDASSAEQRNRTAIAADESAELQDRYARQEEERRRTGRYNLEDAAKVIEEGANEGYALILAKLVRAAGNGTLPTYMPFSNVRTEYGSGQGRCGVVSPFYDECYWDDLNKWLAENEPRMSFRFEATISSDALMPVPPPPVSAADMPTFRDHDTDAVVSIAEISKLKKSALVKKYEIQWPAAGADISNCTRNGLYLASLGGGFYDEAKAIQWAKERGKFKETILFATPSNSILNSPTSVKRRV